MNGTKLFKRINPDPDFSLQSVPGNRADVPAVRTIITIIPHTEILIFSQSDRQLYQPGILDGLFP